MATQKTNAQLETKLAVLEHTVLTQNLTTETRLADIQDSLKELSKKMDKFMFSKSVEIQKIQDDVANHSKQDEMKFEDIKNTIEKLEQKNDKKVNMVITIVTTIATAASAIGAWLAIK